MFKNKIQMVDLQSQYHRIKVEVDEAIQEVLNSTAFIQGPQVKEFEKEFSSFHHNAHVISCANGTDALQIAMMALDFKSGDEVILPVFTYVATAEVIALLGLKPVFVDVEPNTFNIDVKQVEAKITSRTVAIVPVHLFGQCADMEPLLAIAKKHNVKIIEDYAQAIGAVYTFLDGTQKKAGTMGTVGCTSFFPSKNLGCYGDGGAVVTTDEALAVKIKMISNHGQRVKYYHDCIGVNSRLDTLQAAILKVKLHYLKEYEQKRSQVAKFYDNALKETSFFETPYRSANSTHVFHQYTLKLNDINREHFKKQLEINGVPVMVYYPLPLHFQKAYKMNGIGLGSFPVSEDLSSRVLSLPIHTEMDEEQLHYICDTIKNYQA
jgi:dTDP-4-amino-4,6-dideoxygalactose transaminase